MGTNLRDISICMHWVKRVYLLEQDDDTDVYLPDQLLLQSVLF